MPSPETGRAPESATRRPSAARIRAARLVAVAADAIQIGFMPAFAGGALSLLNDALDVVVAIILVSLVGWHFAFLPSLVAELVPGVDLVPTWTVAVLIATHGSKPDHPPPPPPGGGAGAP
ncbi:MAG TPA: hypothetical protein VGK89_00565 [Candidatus Eisenbacteria bacterium]|jgi:hypothetical protein